AAVPSPGGVCRYGPRVTPGAPADVPKVPDPCGDSDGPRQGSLCDRHCAAINSGQGDPAELGCHLRRARVPPAAPSPCCQQHSEEVCESCVVKTTLTAENAVEANKLSNNYKFGFKKWKSHVTARPWEDRSDIVKELYSDLTVIRGSGGEWPWGQPWLVAGRVWAAAGDAGAFPPTGSPLTCGNVLYLLLFGWWLSLLYVLVAAVMFVTIMGAPYGRLCWDLAWYFLWPFGKVIQKVEVRLCLGHPLGGVGVPCAHPDVPPSPQVPKSHQACEAGVGESSALLGGPTPRRWRPRCWVGTGHWHHASTAVWLCLGYPVLALAHGLVCVAAWLLIVLIPVAKLSARALSRVLLLPPERLLVRRLRTTEVPLEGEVILCCYRAANPYYYKYAVDGINVFAVNLLPLVLVTLVLGYMDSANHLTGSAVKFTLALLSIMPLSYYIGMAIASISAQSNFAVGAVVNATFGSITELTFYITALIKGSREGDRCYAEVVKSALTGTLVGCVLFVPGLCMVIGGIRHQEQRFNSRSAGVSSALLFLSVGG
ncbi:VNX1 protein, partial [Spelaeornis formosus]|nr:VNX1 protein [Elachura formosa]